MHIKQRIKSLLGNVLSETIHEKKDKVYNIFHSFIFFFKRKYNKYFILKKNEKSITIGMLAIRRYDYVNLAIQSINSLHYYNNKNKVVLYLDDYNITYFKKNTRKLDYPENVQPIIVSDNKNLPWQFTKLNVVLELSKNSIPFVDADSIWHDDISNYFSSENTTFLVKINKFSENEYENNLISSILHKPYWSDFYHYNVGFVFIHPNILSNDFISFCNNFIINLLELKNNNMISNELFRVCEEMTLSIASQIFDKDIQTLKNTDGPGDKYLIESIYYGCQKGI